jgi:hypothetical protein
MDRPQNFTSGTHSLPASPKRQLSHNGLAFGRIALHTMNSRPSTPSRSGFLTHVPRRLSWSHGKEDWSQDSDFKNMNRDLYMMGGDLLAYSCRARTQLQLSGQLESLILATARTHTRRYTDLSINAPSP